jgi:hypothetical protein
MKTITPHALAFTVYRIIAVILILQGIWSPLEWYFNDGLYGIPDDRNPLDHLKNGVPMVLSGALLYLLSYWLAKVTVWKLRDSN